MRKADLATEIYEKVGVSKKEAADLVELVLNTIKTGGRQRKYTPKDIETLLQIKRMRYEQGFTLEGLKRRWHTRAGMQERRPSRDTIEVVRRVKHEVHEMLKVLGDST